MNYFFVFQNKTFDKEFHGGYLWAPKGRFSHWKNMCNIKKGDIIFHSNHKKIVAVSIATSDCYEANQPKELQIEEMWENDGWKVNCNYYLMKEPIITSDYMQDILKIQPTKYAPFNTLGRGNTGYLFDCSVKMAELFLDKLSAKNLEALTDIKMSINKKGTGC